LQVSVDFSLRNYPYVVAIVGIPGLGLLFVRWPQLHTLTNAVPYDRALRTTSCPTDSSRAGRAL